MANVFAIDPGPIDSAWAWLEDGTPTDFIIEPNQTVLERIRMYASIARRSVEDVPDAIVIEKIEGYGLRVGMEVMETIFWSGRYVEAANDLIPVTRISRKKVKGYLCNDARANDSDVRAALIDLFGGKATAFGTKSDPGPLQGIPSGSDVWAAIAVGVTYEVGGERG